MKLVRQSVAEASFSLLCFSSVNNMDQSFYSERVVRIKVILTGDAWFRGGKLVSKEGQF